MAEEDIEISQLEIKEELSSDDLIPVETSLTTYATTLGRIRDWLKQFFVNISENQTIGGTKTFSKSPLVPTPSVNDSSKKSANTAWVEQKIAALTQQIENLNQTLQNSVLRYPDYENRVSKNANTNYTAEFDGLLFIYGQEGYRSYRVTINGVSYPYIYHGGDGYSSGELPLFIKKDDTFRIEGAGSNEIYLIPYRQ